MIKVRMRFPGRTLGAMLIGLTLVIAAPALSGASPSQGGNKGSLTMGSKNLPGAQVLGQVYGQALAKDGYQMAYKENLGTTEVVFAALQNGDIDLYPDYMNTVVQFLGGTGGADVTQVKSELDTLLQGKGIVATTAIAPVRIPAHTRGSAIGASTPRRSCRPDMPMPRAASRTSGSTPTMPM